MSRKGQLTPQRKAIYEVIMESHDHPTAAEIIERLSKRGQQFAYATTYNSLRYLTEEGLIRELKLDGDASRYDARTEEHQHIVCRVCGKVDEVFTHVPAEWARAVAEETGYVVEEEHILLKGVCPECSSSGK
ncbi:transcriptional repressor [Paenibacillus doosanensis]|uniref:Peroxide operon regulator n=1 Tax=Paenibacillus konkukensis TaxID=2020716 RepID=A0ABY4RR21_9BACL|nr:MULTISPECIES: transcriptional repressor [Paenibacillus]MCS7463950.1 transcriptional repressor [Paenibacillus doosanensis]UQZ83834.1 Peroxide operon regulator [Paenibacillus konkukensis]